MLTLHGEKLSTKGLKESYLIVSLDVILVAPGSVLLRTLRVCIMIILGSLSL